MTEAEILEQLKRLPKAQRLKVAESLLHQLRKDLETEGKTKVDPLEKRLARAAKSLRRDYATDGELTAFTVLDNEPFHA
jgi:hypothetical protein